MIKIAGLIAAFTVYAVTAATDDQAIRTTLSAKYSAIASAMKRRDTVALVKMTTPNLIFVDPTGKSLKGKDATDALKGELGMFQTIDAVKFNLVKLQVKGNTAIAQTNSIVKGKVVGRRLHSMRLDTVSRETWSKTKSGWLIAKLETLSVKPYLDAKTG